MEIDGIEAIPASTACTAVAALALRSRGYYGGAGTVQLNREPGTENCERLRIKFITGAFVLLCSGALAFFENCPQRIISLGPAITEELYILGVQDKLIGCTVYCRTPADAKEKEKVGTAMEINVEKVVSLKPDVVLATSLTNLEAKQKLKQLGIRVITFPAAMSFREICAQFLEIGKIVSREKEAEDITGVAKSKVDSTKERVSGLQRPTVFVQVGARPLFAATRDSFINDFIEFAGGINVACDTKSGLYSRERVLKDDPDVIIIVSMGMIGEEEKEIWGKYKSLKAVKNNRVHIVDSDKFCSPTPVTFVKALEEMVGILHPEVVKE